MKLATAKIGKCGELLVQYRLLRLGIDSAPMSTDSGIDLVAYSPGNSVASTIQVKTNLKPKPGGGKGGAAIDWWLPESCPAQLVAFVNLETEKIWLMSLADVEVLAQQRSNGRWHLYMYTDPIVNPRKAGRPMHAYEFESFLLENRAHKLFDAPR